MRGLVGREGTGEGHFAGRCAGRPTQHAVSVHKLWPVALGVRARWQLPPHTAVDEYTPSIQVEMSSVQPKRANPLQSPARARATPARAPRRRSELVPPSPAKSPWAAVDSPDAILPESSVSLSVGSFFCGPILPKHPLYSIGAAILVPQLRSEFKSLFEPNTANRPR